MTKTVKPVELPPIINANLIDLQQAAIDNINALRRGETTPANANAVVNQISSVFRSAKMQMDYARAVGRKPNVALLNDGLEQKDED